VVSMSDTSNKRGDLTHDWPNTGQQRRDAYRLSELPA
jgi:hypothetical protein